MVSLSSVPTTLRVTHNIGDQRPHFPLNFTLPHVGREQPYGMSTAIMEGLHPSASTYADNEMVVVSLYV